MKVVPIERILWLFKSALLLQCIGVFFYLKGGSAIETMLFMEVGLEQAQSKLIENIVAWVFLIFGLVTFFKPDKYLLVIIALLTLGLAYVIKRQAGSPFTDWSIPAHFIRIILPIGILLLANYNRKINSAYWLLLVGLIVTFITHGLEAWSLHPRFIDYLLISSENTLGLRIKQSTAEILLKAIGSLDILAAVSGLIFSKNAIFYWMAFWGFITAFARVTELGLGLFPEVLIRAGHYLVPIGLVWLNGIRNELKAP
ncbi:hypothetical protein [Aquiflexum sp.]|uniref:hypothetical protein n=1 Tax=Aquiflexum sp. TaxID=1872584 RepID=UPI003594631A